MSPLLGDGVGGADSSQGIYGDERGCLALLTVQ